MARGGARPGAGRKKGVPEAKTLHKMAVAAAFNQRVLTHADQLFQAQLGLAVGSIRIFRVEETKDKKGNLKREHILVTDAFEMKEVLDENDGASGVVGDSYYLVTDIPPDNRAIDSMLNRSFGKPKETVEVVNPDIAAIKQEVINALTQEGIPEPQIQAVLQERYPEISDAVN